MASVVYCEAVTKKGDLCLNAATEGSSLCHVHDPALQCGHLKRNGTPCRIATGGTKCKHHRGPNPNITKRSRSHRRRHYTAAERAHRRNSREQRISAALAEIDALARGAAS